MRQSENALISHLRTIDAECTISPLPLPREIFLLLLDLEGITGKGVEETMHSDYIYSYRSKWRPNYDVK